MFSNVCDKKLIFKLGNSNSRSRCEIFKFLVKLMAAFLATVSLLSFYFNTYQNNVSSSKVSLFFYSNKKYGVCCQDTMSATFYVQMQKFEFAYF